MYMLRFGGDASFFTSRYNNIKIEKLKKLTQKQKEEEARKHIGAIKEE